MKEIAIYEQMGYLCGIRESVGTFNPRTLTVFLNREGKISLMGNVSLFQSSCVEDRSCDSDYHSSFAKTMT
ncbi:MAG: hypothetical protein ACE5OZ_02410 [Candidatus Heimdallarchaeota archaeon]